MCASRTYLMSDFFFFFEQIKAKDRLLDGLRTELEDLRGPLPLDYATDNADTISLASEVNF